MKPQRTSAPNGSYQAMTHLWNDKGATLGYSPSFEATAQQMTLVLFLTRMVTQISPLSLRQTVARMVLCGNATICAQAL